MTEPKCSIEQGTEVEGRGRALVSTLPRQINSSKELIGETIIIEGVERKIAGVELYMHAGPWRKGESCAFIFEKT